MRILSTAFFLFLFSLDGIAQIEFQPGYIITSLGDTVSGLVHYSPGKERDVKVQFKRAENSSVEVYDPAMITGFGYWQTDRYFASFTMPSGSGDEKVFAETLVSGKASLYVYGDFFYLQKDSVNKRIDKEQIRELNQADGRYVHVHKTYIGTLNQCFSDCLPARLLRGEVSYSERDFVDVFKKYSQCSGAEYHVYKLLPQKRRIRYYALIGMNNSSLKFQEADLNIFKSDNSFFFGGGLVVPLNLISENVFLTGEVAFHRNSYRGQKEGYTPSGAVQKDYTVEMSLIKIPVGLKVNLLKGSFIPYFRGGLTPFIPLRASWAIRYQGTTEAEYRIEEKTASLVYWGGLGFEMRVGDKSVFAELRMEKFIDFIGFYGPSGATNIPSNVLNKMLVFGFNF